jgi:starch synthase
MLDAVKRAIGVYRSGEAWKNIMRSGMKQDFSWSKSAQEYIKLYEKIMAEV